MGRLTMTLHCNLGSGDMLNNKQNEKQKPLKNQLHQFKNTYFPQIELIPYSPTVLDGCTVVTLSRDFCFFSLSLSLRRWQRWWWWWWWALSWLCPGPAEDWATSERSRLYVFSPSSWRCFCVSEDAERLMGLRSTIGWEGEGGRYEEKKVEKERRVWWF